MGSYSERDNWSLTGALADSAEIIQSHYTLYAIRERYCISEGQIQHDGIPCTSQQAKSWSKVALLTS